MTIRKRLAVSHVLMLLIPIAITVIIALACLGMIWYTVVRGPGLGFGDSEDFYQAAPGISALAAEALEKEHPADRQRGLEALGNLLDERAMSLVVTAGGTELYRYGAGGESPEDAGLTAAAAVMGNEGTLSSGERNLRVSSLESQGTDYVIYLFNTQRELSYTGLKTAVVIAGSVLLLTIFLSVMLTDRFLTRFIFRRIEEPLGLLAGGVHQIRAGNLDYRLTYQERDEFYPVCQDFNAMAQRLKDSVERSRREEESRKELMAGLSHDLRTPLTSIQASVEGLLDGVAATPEARHRYLSTIKRRAEELERMVARILAYSRLDMEKAPRSAVLLPLEALLARELSELGPDYEARGLTVTAELAPFPVLADPGELHDVFVNLADNSLKYKNSPQGHLRITLEDRGETCCLTFADDGPGVPEEALPKLFDVFYRTDPSRSDRSKGSGLGLAIVQKTVCRMGGAVEAKNGPQGGLVITMTLMRGEEDNAENSDH